MRCTEIELDQCGEPIADLLDNQVVDATLLDFEAANLPMLLEEGDYAPPLIVGRLLLFLHGLDPALAELDHVDVGRDVVGNHEVVDGGVPKLPLLPGLPRPYRSGNSPLLLTV